MIHLTSGSLLPLAFKFCLIQNKHLSAEERTAVELEYQLNLLFDDLASLESGFVDLQFFSSREEYV